MKNRFGTEQDFSEKKTECPQIITEYINNDRLLVFKVFTILYDFPMSIVLSYRNQPEIAAAPILFLASIHIMGILYQYIQLYKSKTLLLGRKVKNQAIIRSSTAPMVDSSQDMHQPLQYGEQLQR